MVLLPLRRHPRFCYEPAHRFVQAWDEVAAEVGGHTVEIGRSVEGRPITAFSFGANHGDAPTILLTGLMHGIEIVGSVGLRALVRTVAVRHHELSRSARFVVVPMVNPDAYFENGARIARGERAWQRTNANGVDLNRNFPRQADIKTWHPFSGSPRPGGWHYTGPHAFSEPESRAVRDLVAHERPAYSLAFHSFGNLLLYPWGYTKANNPRQAAYERLGRAFNGAAVRPYVCKQSIGLYPTIGDMDDWLDGEEGCMALTVEVGTLCPSVLMPRRMLDPFCWMNTPRVETEIASLIPATVALLRAAVEPAMQVTARQHRRRRLVELDLAARK